MKNLVKYIGYVLLIIASIIILLISYGLIGSGYEHKVLVTENIHDVSKLQKISLERSKYDTLPNPVIRYFDYAFNGQQHVHVKSVNWNEVGEFMLPVGDFTVKGQQASLVTEPTYVWKGDYSVLGFVPFLESRDAFLIENHDMRAKVLGLKTVMHTEYSKSKQVNALHSYLMLRYYGTALNFPWALLPNEYVGWEPIDDNHAYLVLKKEHLSGRYIVTFGENGQITNMDTDDFMLHGNESWLKEFGEKKNYQEVNGFMVPTQFEYSWFTKDEHLDSYYKFKLTELEFIKE